MSLPDDIKKYHFQNYDILGDYKFHFISRLYLWCRDSESASKLDLFKESYSIQNIESVLRKKIDSAKQDKISSKNANKLREKFWLKYGEIRGINRILFSMTFAKNIFDNDCIWLLNKFYDINYIESFEKDLMDDQEAIAILSTHAINFFYLYNKVFKLNEGVDSEYFYNIGQSNIYNLHNKIHIQLLIYLYTHCIIGETKFYYREIPHAKMDIYIKMIEFLDYLIRLNYFYINLDNKLEFLVCCKILGYTSNLEDFIMNESDVSVSDSGCFIVDKFNLNVQSNNTSFHKSEHRNVLYLMSNYKYDPISKK
jgi:hypothetical protein